jgi:hypothetical protein
MAHDEAILGDGLADHRKIEVPFVEDRAGRGLLFGVEHHQHPLLGFRQHHLIGGHRRFAHRHKVEVERDAKPALVAHLDRRTGQPGRAHILDRDYRAAVHQFEARLQQTLFGERVADLHGGAFFLQRVVEFGRRHGRAADPVAPGLGTQIDDRPADTRSGGIEDAVGPRDPGGKGVDQAVAVIGGVKADLATDGRHPETVAIAADAGDHPRDQAARSGVIGGAEAQAVHRRDGPRPHGEDVAQDPAHAGGGALIGLDIARVVVALHLEDDGKPVADIDHPGILARAADHLRAVAGQQPQPALRRFVRAVLVPHRRKDADFGQCRRAIQQPQDLGIFVGRQPVCGDQIVGDLGVFHRTSLLAVP